MKIVSNFCKKFFKQQNYRSCRKRAWGGKSEQIYWKWRNGWYEGKQIIFALINCSRNFFLIHLLLFWSDFFYYSRLRFPLFVLPAATSYQSNMVEYEKNSQRNKPRYDKNKMLLRQVLSFVQSTWIQCKHISSHISLNINSFYIIWGVRTEHNNCVYVHFNLDMQWKLFLFACL